MKLQILPAAQNDLIEAYWFYEVQSEDLGDYFLRSLMDDIERLSFLAGRHPLHFGKHRLLASTFPYSIYYTVDEDTVKIFAVLDDRRDPALAEKRLT